MTSRAFELLVSLRRDGTQTLRAQIEDQIRRAIRAGLLGPDSALPSTRELASQLQVSRPVVVEAYDQLAAEGFLALKQGARPRVAGFATRIEAPIIGDLPAAAPRYNFLPAVPDLSAFPRKAWLHAVRDALTNMTDEDFGYREQHGCVALCQVLAEYLGRVRGVVAHPSHLIVTSGFAQGRSLACRALVALGAKRIAVENPSYSEWAFATSAGLKLVPIPVDEDGLRIDILARKQADAVIVTPAHQFPTGAVMSGERRMALLTWLRANNAIAIEDDYDFEFRYDHAPVGALQGLEPNRILYAGTASKTLSPGLRLGWLVAPTQMIAAVRSQQLLTDFGAPRIDQHALARLMASGGFDRHLRRMRLRYRGRRDAMIDALAASIPEARVVGVAAGLHATVQLPDSDDEFAIRDEAARRGLAIGISSEFYLTARNGPPALLLGYARSSESVIRTGVRVLVAAIRAARVR